jgi:ABC-type multidrug transport system permease subunit
VASTIAFAIFFVFMDVERWLQRLHEERTPSALPHWRQWCLPSPPHLFTLAVTVSFVLLASLFYPSRIVISLWKNKADRKMLLEDTEMSSYTTIKYHLYHAVPFV